MTSTCTCGHEREAHEHYRAGTDCSLCEPCVAYRGAASIWSSLFTRRRPAVAAASPAR